MTVKHAWGQFSSQDEHKIIFMVGAKNVAVHHGGINIAGCEKPICFGTGEQKGEAAMTHFNNEEQ